MKLQIVPPRIHRGHDELTRRNSFVAEYAFELPLRLKGQKAREAKQDERKEEDQPAFPNRHLGFTVKEKEQTCSNEQTSSKSSNSPGTIQESLIASRSPATIPLRPLSSTFPPWNQLNFPTELPKSFSQLFHAPQCGNYLPFTESLH